MMIMQSKNKPKEYRVTLRTAIKISAIDVYTAYGGLVDLINNMKEKEKGNQFVKKLFKLEEI